MDILSGLTCRSTYVIEPLILYDDGEVIVAQKPSGVPVHHSKEHVDAEVALLQLVRDAVGARVYTVHRLDRATSGAVLFGRTPEAANRLRDALSSAQSEKWYLALTKGRMDVPISSIRPLTKRETGVVQVANSTFWPLAVVAIPESQQHCTLVRVRIFTGRRHQIRRHLNHLRHQILGDTTYGKGRVNRHVRAVWNLHRLALHAERIVVPWNGGSLDVSATVPADLQRIIRGAQVDLEDVNLPRY